MKKDINIGDLFVAGSICFFIFKIKNGFIHYKFNYGNIHKQHLHDFKQCYGHYVHLAIKIVK